MTDANIKGELLLMGFSEEKIEKAIKASSGNPSLESAIDWLVTHNDEVEPCVGEKGEKDTSGAEETTAATNEADLQVNSYKCEECGKQLRSTQDMMTHQARTNHSQFAQSTEEIKPKSEEELRAAREAVQQRIKEKQAERANKEAEEAVQREKNRRMQGKEVSGAKSRFEEDEMKRIAEQKRREKQEDAEYRKRLREQIAQDKAEKLADAAAAAAKTGTSSSAATNQVQAAAAPVAPSTVSSSTTCRLQIRRPNGTPIVETFQATDTLTSVIDYYKGKLTSELGEHATSQLNIKIKTTMPPKTFEKEDESKSLRELGLCPSMVVMVTHN